MRETPDAIPQLGGLESAGQIEAGRTRLEFQSSAFRWLQLATVLSVDRNDEGRWDGFLTVQLQNIEGTRNKVKMTVAAAGNGLFVGGPPEVGSLLVLGHLPGGRPIVLSQVPINVEALYQRKGLPDMVEGEVLLRSGNLSGSTQVAGASVLMDRDGRVIVRDREGRIEVVVGPDLTDDGQPRSNPETDQPIRLVVNATNASGDRVLRIAVDDGGNLLLEADRVNLLANSVAVGDNPNDFDTLVTRRWVEEVFKTHMHPTAGTGAPSPPTPQSESGYTEVLRSK